MEPLLTPLPYPLHSALFLDHHLRKTIAFIENFTTIQLVAIGIGHDVTDTTIKTLLKLMISMT